MSGLTVRQHAEAIRERHLTVIVYDEEADDHVEACVCGGEGPCPDHLDAVAIIRALDEAPRVNPAFQHHGGECVLPDPVVHHDTEKNT